MGKIYGHIAGLKSNVLKDLERLYLFNNNPNEIISQELAKLAIRYTKELGRVIGFLINRAGAVEYIIVGDHHKLFIPELGRSRGGGKRFRGLRLFHTRLNYEQLNVDDLTDLYKLRLDMVSVLTMSPGGEGDLIYSAVINASASEDYHYLEPISLKETDIGFLQFIHDLEVQFQRDVDQLIDLDNREKAIVIYVSDQSKSVIQSNLDELDALCKTAGINVVEKIIQRKKPNPQTIIGVGKLEEVLLQANKFNCDLLIFNHTLKPAQLKSLSNILDEKIIDRNMLILDIFAQHASSNDGKIQVELAQLKYMAPRLIGKGKAFSRLMGGIGGRGPGETKLEVDRRRLQNRMKQLQNKQKIIARKRNVQRKKRIQSDAILVSLVGYTNVGKSTILNRVTKSKALVADKLFATLETTSRSCFYQNHRMILSDTVGFIRELPEELLQAFMATIEEIKYADIILHVVDLSDPEYQDKMASVERILERYNLLNGEVVYLFNKIDRLPVDEVQFRKYIYPDALFTSATDSFDSGAFFERVLEERLEEEIFEEDQW